MPKTNSLLSNVAVGFLSVDMENRINFKKNYEMRQLTEVTGVFTNF